MVGDKFIGRTEEEEEEEEEEDMVIVRGLSFKGIRVSLLLFGDWRVPKPLLVLCSAATAASGDKGIVD